MKCPGCEADADSLKCTQCGARTREEGQAEYSIDDETVDADIAAAVDLDHDKTEDPAAKSDPEEDPKSTTEKPKPSFGMFGGW